MKTIKNLLLLSIITLGASFTTNLAAQDSASLSSRAGVFGRILSNREASRFQRVNDQGRPIVFWGNQVIFRHRHDSFVNRNEGRATARDEDTSQSIILHTRGNGTGLRAGHVYSNRGN